MTTTQGAQQTGDPGFSYLLWSDSIVRERVAHMRMEGCLDLGGAGVGPDGGERPVRRCVGGDGFGLFARGACGGIWAGVGGGVGARRRRLCRASRRFGCTCKRRESGPCVAAVGDDEYPLSLMPENAFYQNPFGNNNPEGISPAWISFFPDLAFDSWVTIGLDGPSSSSAGEEGGDDAVCERVGKRVWVRARVHGGQREWIGVDGHPLDGDQHPCRA